VSGTYIPKALRKRVAAQAKYRCDYCLTQEEVVGMEMELDHLVPRAQQGETNEGNLWLACSACNNAKKDRTTARDPLTDEEVELFNPRKQVWDAHFCWTPECDRLIGLTSTGRATIVALNLNRYYLVRSRRIWVKTGWHLPRD